MGEGIVPLDDVRHGLPADVTDHEAADGHIAAGLNGQGGLVGQRLCVGHGAAAVLYRQPGRGIIVAQVLNGIPRHEDIVALTHRDTSVGEAREDLAGAGILRAVGDSQRPFYFLVLCAILNTVLDLLFVLVFKMGVEGVALATIISQAVSAVLILIVLMRSNSCIKFSPRKLKADWMLLKKIFQVGIPAAIQMAITSFSNVFVQSYINYFGADCMSGWTAYSKVDALIFLPMQSIGMASTTFVGQNLGKNQVERAKEGVRKSLILCVISVIIIMIPLMVFSAPIVSFFNQKPEVIEYGTLLLRWLTPFYLLSCFNQIYSGALRGAGNSKAPTVIMLSTFVVFRQVYLFIMSRVCNEIIPIAMGYPAGWFLCSLITTIYFHKVPLNKNRLVDDERKS